MVWMVWLQQHEHTKAFTIDADSVDVRDGFLFFIRNHNIVAGFDMDNVINFGNSGVEAYGV